MSNDKYTLGMIGLGTMGRNLLLNMADHGFAVAGYDKDPSKLTLLENEGTGKPVKAFASLNDFVNSLDHPRVIMLLVPAGKIVDAVIDELQPLLTTGDIIIDGGNSHFNDTTARINRLAQKGLHFFRNGYFRWRRRGKNRSQHDARRRYGSLSFCKTRIGKYSRKSKW